MTLETIRAYGLEVEEGIISKNRKIRALRNGKILFDNMSLAGLRSFKKEVTEVRSGQECGLSFVQNYTLQKGDTIECYDEKVAE